MNKFTRLAGLPAEVEVCVGAEGKLLRLVEGDTECEAEPLLEFVAADETGDGSTAPTELNKPKESRKHLASPSNLR